MFRSYALAPLRCVALALLAVFGFVASLPLMMAIGAVVTYPHVLQLVRRLTALSRWLAHTWSGVVIEPPYREGPVPAPLRRPDGWYEHDGQLFKTPHYPAFFLRMQWLSDDPATARDWMWLVLLAPIGGLIALLSPALVVAGVLLALGVTGPGRRALDDAGLIDLVAWPVLTMPGWAVLAAGVAAVVTGVLAGPALLRAHGRWVRTWLGHPGLTWWQSSGIGAWLRKGGHDTWKAALLLGLSLTGFAVFLLTVLLTLLSGGFGIAWLAYAIRPMLNQYRRLCVKWGGGEPMPEPYRQREAVPEPGPDGRYRVGRTLYATRDGAHRAGFFPWILGDPATWRDLAWMATAPLVAMVAVVPGVLIGAGYFGLFWQALFWPLWAVPFGLITDVWISPWYVWQLMTLGMPALNGVPGWLSIPIGLALGLLGVLLAGPVLRLITGSARLLLAPSRSARLTQRVEHLAQTRAEAVDAQSAELRRIERDLHDGAQARLVAVGLSLGTVEQLMDRDPAAARVLLAQARETSAAALAELRDLVRGIHPPVLAERGLADAVRALALDSALPVEVRAELAGQPPAPVATAAYFAVAEALTNAARHAQASRVGVDIRHTGGLLRVTVTDDGRGGAEPAHGGGLHGLRRRLATFDGTVALHSPLGGPTVLTLEIPCALSSPRTSTS
ncbi:sensor histidine kinase [Catellatospora sichuanensis]|uniref:sensor histidine kinase n=1 Tax=Catellatospora sichuanensis TaxID=1969805 RepID=UPI00118344F3|nr:sensor histidine kinase [Catellatospora sichuanensis]